MLTHEEKLDRDRTWALEEGGMHFERRSAVHETLERLTKSLNELGVDYAVAGAMAMFLHGFRRFTEDVDILVTREGLRELHQTLIGQRHFDAAFCRKSFGCNVVCHGPARSWSSHGVQDSVSRILRSRVCTRR